MRKCTFYLLIVSILFSVYDSRGQTARYVYTVAGGGTIAYPEIYPGGVPATDANLLIFRGICVDESDNIYFVTEIGGSKIYKVNAAGIINRFIPTASFNAWGLAVNARDVVYAAYLTGDVNKINRISNAITPSPPSVPPDVSPKRRLAA